MTTPRSSPAPTPEFPAGEPRPNASDAAADTREGASAARPTEARSALDRLIDRLEADEYPDEAVMESRRAFVAECRDELAALREWVAKLEAALRGGRIDPDKVTPERIERLVSAARWAAQTLRSHAFSASSLSKAGDDLHAMIGQVAMPFEIPDLDITGGMDSADYVRKMRDGDDE